jgi:NADPH-dependent 2,4-dienoyl-CoA reductase/sulfur reductase-like enzyme
VVDVDCAQLAERDRARLRLIPGQAEVAPPPQPRPLRLSVAASPPATAAAGEHVVVVGSGPAGLFCALSLVEVRAPPSSCTLAVAV